MELNQLIVNLKSDLRNEYKHMNFYIAATTNVTGINRADYHSFFEKAAKGEMGHVLAFRRLIISLGGSIDETLTIGSSHVPDTDPKSLLNTALLLEEEVVANYAERMDQCDHVTNQTPGFDKLMKFVRQFLEHQLVDSQTDAFEIKQLLS